MLATNELHEDNFADNLTDTIPLPKIKFLPSLNLTPEQVNELYDLMVEHLGASNDHEGRTNFLHAYLGEVIPSEYRMGNRLGIGGKLVYASGHLEVSMYPEHRTSGRIKIQAETNEALEAFLARIR